MIERLLIRTDVGLLTDADVLLRGFDESTRQLSVGQVTRSELWVREPRGTAYRGGAGD